MIKFLEPILERCWINFAIFLFSAIKVKNKLKFQIKVVSLDKKITIVGRFRWRHFLLTMHFFYFCPFWEKLLEVECPSLLFCNHPNAWSDQPVTKMTEMVGLGVEQHYCSLCTAPFYSNFWCTFERHLGLNWQIGYQQWSVGWMMIIKNRFSGSEQLYFCVINQETV